MVAVRPQARTSASVIVRNLMLFHGMPKCKRSSTLWLVNWARSGAARHPLIHPQETDRRHQDTEVGDHAPDPLHPGTLGAGQARRVRDTETAGQPAHVGRIINMKAGKNPDDQHINGPADVLAANRLSHGAAVMDA